MSVRLFYPPGENVVAGHEHGLLVTRIAGPINPLVEYDNTIFELRKFTAAKMHFRIREWTLASTGLQVADSGTPVATGNLSLTLTPVVSGTSLAAIGAERGMCDHGGWYGAASTQPGWDIGDPGPISMRFGECLPVDGFRTVDGQRYVAISGRETVGPLIEFTPVGDDTMSFGIQPGYTAATFSGVLPALLNTFETGFTLKLAGPSNAGVFFDLVGVVTLTPSRYWTYGGIYDETTGERL